MTRTNCKRICISFGLAGFKDPAAMGMGARIDSKFVKMQNKRYIERNCGIIDNKCSNRKGETASTI